MAPSHVIDADGHVVEPFDMWQEYLPAEYRDDAPRLVEVDGVERLSILGVELEQEFTIADFATPQGLGAGGRTGRRFAEIHRAAIDPVERLALLDEQGVDMTVLYPSMLLNLDMFPDGIRQGLCSAYNRWMSDFCSADPSRLKWATPVSRNDIATSIVEFERAVELGASAAFFVTHPTYAGTLIGEAEEDGLVAAVASSGLPLAIHASDPINSTLGWGNLLKTRYQWDALSAVMGVMMGLTWVFSNGMLDRFGELRVAFLEGNVGWFPYLIDKLGLSYEHLATLFPAPERSPLQQFRERCWISGETEEPGLIDVVELIGADRCLWSSDFPHYESEMDPLSELTSRDDLTAEHRDDILYTSAVEFYGFDELGRKTPSDQTL